MTTGTESQFHLTSRESYPIDDLRQNCVEGRRLVELSGVELENAFLVLSDLARQLDQPMVILTALESDAKRLVEELQIINRTPGQVGHVPAIEASPYGHLSPDRRAVMELLSALNALAWDQWQNMIVVSVAALMRRVLPAETLLEHAFIVDVGQELDRRSLLRTLADGGYRAVSVVEDRGTFAVRGSIIDVFPADRESPVRIEFWGDEVDDQNPIRKPTYAGGCWPTTDVRPCT